MGQSFMYVPLPVRHPWFVHQGSPQTYISLPGLPYQPQNQVVSKYPPHGCITDWGFLCQVELLPMYVGPDCFMNFLLSGKTPPVLHPHS
jgi:hypothetical protein